MSLLPAGTTRPAGGLLRIMPRATTNKSLRVNRPVKALRREPIARVEADDSHRVAGASGTPRRARKRPGRAASLLTSNASKRSQRWRSVAQGKVKRQASPAQRAARIREGSKNS